MSYLVDTDWVADYLKGRQPAVQRLDALVPDGPASSLITYEGIDREAHEAGFRAFLRAVTVLPPNKSILKHFARIRGELRAQGQLIGDLDILIAATALYYDLTLLTRNIKHFERIPDLPLFEPDQ